MVSKTVGAWVKDGITDQTTSAMQVSTAKRHFALSFVLIMDLLLCAVDIRFGRKIPTNEPSDKQARSRGQLIEKQPFEYAAASVTLGSKRPSTLNPQPIPQRVPCHGERQQWHAEGAAAGEGGDGEFGHGVELLFLTGDGFGDDATGEA